MTCVTSISYSIGINDGASDFVILSRGLRQENPLNPHLFFLCAEVFSIILNDAKRSAEAQIGRQRLAINHLFFADDSILFGRATREGALNVQNAILEYENALSQKVNVDKTLIYFGSNVVDRERETIGNLLRVRISLSP